MKDHTCRIITALLICGLLGAMSAASAQETRTTEETYIRKTTLVDKVPGGEIDWGNGMMYAWGEGVMPKPSEEPNRAKAYLKAKGYARMQAIANLLMVLEGTSISFEGYGRDYMAEDEILRQKVEGYVKGVEVLEEKREAFEGDTIVKVKIGSAMYGKTGPFTLFLRKVAEDESNPIAQSLAPPKIKVELPEVMAIAQDDTPVPSEQKGPFTSVIIDARGFGVIRSMSPKVRRADGSEVWGTIPVTPEFVNETGIVTYAISMEMAEYTDRTGDNPLILRAIGRAGGKAMCDVVISDPDAELLIAENEKSKFLDQFKVIMIVDPPTR